MKEHELTKSKRCLYCGALYNSAELDRPATAHEENAAVIHCMDHCVSELEYGVNFDDLDRHGVTYQQRWIAAPAVPWSR